MVDVGQITASATHQPPTTTQHHLDLLAGISWTGATVRACRSPTCAPSLCHHVLRNIRRNGLCRKLCPHAHIASCGPVALMWSWTGSGSGSGSLSPSVYIMPVQLIPFPRIPTGSPPSVCIVLMGACLPFCRPSRGKCFFAPALSHILLLFVVQGQRKDMVLRLWPFTSRSILKCGPLLFSAVPTSSPPD